MRKTTAPCSTVAGERVHRRSVIVTFTILTPTVASRVRTGAKKGSTAAADTVAKAVAGGTTNHAGVGESNLAAFALKAAGTTGVTDAARVCFSRFWLLE